MVVASNLQLQQSFAPIWPEMFLPTFDGIKSVSQYSIFPDFSSKCQLSLTQNKIPDISLTLKIFFPDPFVTSANHVKQELCGSYIWMVFC